MKENKREIFYIAIILGFAFLIRLRFILNTPFDFKIDAQSMNIYVNNVLKGKYYGTAFDHWTGYAYWPPLYIFFQAFVIKFFGDSQDFLAVRIIQCILSSISCGLVYYITKEIAYRFTSLFREAGLIAGILMVFNVSMITYCNQLYSETLFITIYLFIIYLAILYYKSFFQKDTNRKKQKKYLILLGILLGVGNLARPILLLIPIVLWIAIGIRIVLSPNIKTSRLQHFKSLCIHLFLILVLSTTIIAPWTLRNYSVTQRFVFIDVNGPINFYIGHSSLSNGFWVDVTPLENPRDLATTGYRKGFSFICSHPQREMKLIARKTNLFFSQGDYHINEKRKNIDASFLVPVGSTYLAIPQIDSRSLQLISILTFILFFIKLCFQRRWKECFYELIFIIGNSLYLFFIILAFYFAPRYRMIIEPFTIIIFTICLLYLLFGNSSKKKC